MDLFAPWHIVVLVIAFVVIFGAKRLPGAAESLGRSMHIFRKSVQGLTPPADDTGSAANPFAAGGSSATGSWTTPPPAVTPPAVAAPDATQQQLLDLQRQVQDLQRQTAESNGQPSEAQTTRPI
jgi:sec-independent protein translocase protein TatA